jgi:hypothetical protein
MYAMRVADFLALEAMLPHQEMNARGLVVPLSMDGEHKHERVHFISHQWLGFLNADPQGVHLRCMQDVFRRAIAGESLFTTDEDWHAYAKGLPAHLMRTFAFPKTVEGSVLTLVGAERCPFALADFAHAVESGWVRIDQMCIPQIYDGLHTETEIRLAQEDQSKAINSIVYYIRNCYNFWVCAPSGAKHVDIDGLRTNYHSWSSRGWCRLEETAFVLCKSLAGVLPHSGDAACRRGSGLDSARSPRPDGRLLPAAQRCPTRRLLMLREEP